MVVWHHYLHTELSLRARDGDPPIGNCMSFCEMCAFSRFIIGRKQVKELNIYWSSILRALLRPAENSVVVCTVAEVDLCNYYTLSRMREAFSSIRALLLLFSSSASFK